MDNQLMVEPSRFQEIRYQANPPLALILIDRAEQANSLNIATIAELSLAFQLAQQDRDVRAVILTGCGTQAFAGGIELTELRELDPQQACQYAQNGQALMQQIEQLGKPVIAAINGLAIGGGLELALACTLRLAADNARLALPAVKLGLMPGFGGTQRLARLIGRGPAMELLLTGDLIEPEEALRLGMINRITSAQLLFNQARELAQKLSNHAPLAIKYCLDALVGGSEMPLEDGLYLEATLFGLCCATEDMQEGINAYLADRPAQFQGK